MTKQKALKIILGISIAGILFSGYLSYLELFAGSCEPSPISCGTSGFTLASLPACVYGFIMYTTVLITSILGLKSKN